MARVMALWGSARSAGLPPAPDIETADPRVLRACQILDREAELIAMHDADVGKRRADLGGARG